VSTPELSLFAALEELPFTTVMSVLCVILIALFFISGADASSIVMGMMASRGNLEPAKPVVAVLGSMMGGIASALLLVGGLQALQQGAILASVPFTFVIVGLAWSLLRALRAERVPGVDRVTVAPRPPATAGPGAPATAGPGAPAQKSEV
jgi:choline-glycine betaine transporter